LRHGRRSETAAAGPDVEVDQKVARLMHQLGAFGILVHATTHLRKSLAASSQRGWRSVLAQG
jgi:hypothetical protein